MSAAGEEWVLDVTTLNQYVSRSLTMDPALRSVRLRGEVSGFKAYPSGHWYFALKDERCKISCVIFRSDASRMSFRPREGDQVILHGAVRLYEEGGSYQFVADSMRPEGVGSLSQQFERLKARLRAEGLFDPARKRPLPIRPRRIAIVTSEAGAVLHDIRRVAARRDPGVPLVLLPVQVQGEGAAEQIGAAIRRAGTLPMVDVIIAGRGGGSIEDLWAFNEECVARAIADSPVPVISAVGHETDVTIADFAADVRASTPSNAAELAVPDRAETLAALRQTARRFAEAAARRVEQSRLRLREARLALEAGCPERRVSEMRQRAQALRARMTQAMAERVSGLPPRVAMAQMRLDNAMDGAYQAAWERWKRDRASLTALSPRRVLERGYVLATAGGHVVVSSRSAPEAMTLHFYDGTVAVRRCGEENHGDEEKAEL